MYPNREKQGNRPEENDWSGWSEDFKTDEPSRRILGIGRGKARLYAMAGHNGNPKASEAVVKTCVDCYLRRPGVKPVAMQMIGHFMNETAMARIKPSPGYRFDAAMFYLFGDKAAWTVSGKTAVLLFADGSLYKSSEDKVYPSLGMSVNYDGQTQPAFDLPHTVRDKIAIFLCTDTFPGELDIPSITAELSRAKQPSDWLAAVVPGLPESNDAAADEAFFGKTAMAVFLPRKQRFPGFQ